MLGIPSQALRRSFSRARPSPAARGREPCSSPSAPRALEPRGAARDEAPTPTQLNPLRALADRTALIRSSKPRPTRTDASSESTITSLASAIPFVCEVRCKRPLRRLRVLLRLSPRGRDSEPIKSCRVDFRGAEAKGAASPATRIRAVDSFFRFGSPPPARSERPERRGSYAEREWPLTHPIEGKKRLESPICGRGLPETRQSAR